jgi:hypothetical protein
VATTASAFRELGELNRLIRSDEDGTDCVANTAIVILETEVIEMLNRTAVFLARLMSSRSHHATGRHDKAYEDYVLALLDAAARGEPDVPATRSNEPTRMIPARDVLSG